MKTTLEEQKANLTALNELATLFPNLTDDEYVDWLMECTPYPFASLTYCVNKARSLAFRSKGDHVLAKQIANEDVDKAMAELDKKDRDLELNNGH